MGYLEEEGLISSPAKFIKVISEHPDWPVIFMAGEDAYFDTAFLYNPCSDIRIEQGEVLDHELPSSGLFANMSFYTDREQFRGDMEEYLHDEWDDHGYDYSAERQEKYMADPEKAISDDIAEYDKYWRPCIIVKVDN